MTERWILNATNRTEQNQTFNISIEKKRMYTCTTIRIWSAPIGVNATQTRISSQTIDLSRSSNQMLIWATDRDRILTLMRNYRLAFPIKKKSKHHSYTIQLKRRRKGTEKKNIHKKTRKVIFFFTPLCEYEQTAEPPFKYGNRNRFVVCTECLTVSCVLRFFIFLFWK